MQQEFDPYRKWLGIAPKDQPPHHYRLLGIDTFEDDRDVIDAAANRVMSYLKELATGDDAAYSQKLLNEAAQARLCLLNQEAKSAYDEDLRSKLSPQKPPPPRQPDVEPPRQVPPPGPLPMSPPKAVPDAPVLAVRVEKSPVKSVESKPNWRVPLLAGGVAVVSGVVLLAVVLLAGRDDSSSTASSQRSASATADRDRPLDNVEPSREDTTMPLESEYADSQAKLPTTVDSNEAAQLASQISQDYNPDDAEARDAHGRWLCLEKGNWADGLEQLSKSSDENLRNAATQDLTGADDASQRLRLGDVWHGLGTSDESLSGFLDRAVYWYGLAMSSTDPDEAVRAASRILEVDSGDATANFVYGKHLCLSKEDWQRGLSLLAKGTNTELKSVVVQELAGSSTASGRLRLADAWYQLADSDTSLEGFLPRAQHWYELALPDLDDAERERVLKLLAPHLTDAGKEQLVALLEPRLTQEEVMVARELLQIKQQTLSWKPLADEGNLTDCYTLGPNPNAERPAVLLWLKDPKAALKKSILFEWKPVHAYQPDKKQRRSGQKGYTFAGSVLAGHFTLYKFQIRSDVDQQVEVSASTYAATGSRTFLAMSIDGIRMRKNRLVVPLRQGEHLILVDLAHSGSSTPDHSWLRVTLEGKEPIAQMAVP